MIGDDVIDQFKKEHAGEYLDIFNEFEVVIYSFVLLAKDGQHIWIMSLSLSLSALLHFGFPVCNS